MNATTVGMKLVQAISESEHDHDHEEEDVSEGIIIAKGTAMLILFSASMFFGILPFKLSKMFNWTDPQRDSRSNFVVTTLLSFGGGVLLSTTFLHLLPEISENIRALQETNELPKFEFSLAELLMGCGFFIIFFVEEVVHLYLHKHQKKMSTSAFIRGRDPRESLRMRKNGEIRATKNNNSTTISTIDLVVESHESHVDHDHQKNENPQCGHSHEAHSHIPGILKNNDEDDVVVSIRGLLIVLALSVHELFEGLAVGLESSTGNVWLMFGSVAIHKLVIAFCIGVELVNNKTSAFLGIFYVFVFAIVSPAGIGLGMLLTSSENSFAVASVILQGLASGTLLYVIFFEILSKHRSGIISQYIAVLFGYFLMFGLQLISEYLNIFSALKSLVHSSTNYAPFLSKFDSKTQIKLNRSSHYV